MFPAPPPAEKRSNHYHPKADAFNRPQDFFHWGYLSRHGGRFPTETKLNEMGTSAQSKALGLRMTIPYFKMASKRGDS